MRENLKKENKQTNTHSICNQPRKNQPQTLKCTGKTEENREENRRRKNSPKGLSNSACNLVASVEVLIEQLEIYKKNNLVGLNFKGGSN
jgi:hypothetical protein